MNPEVTFDLLISRTIETIRSLIGCAECGMRHPELDLAELKIRWLELTSPNHPHVVESLDSLKAEWTRVHLMTPSAPPEPKQAPAKYAARGPISDHEFRAFLAQLEAGVQFPD